MKNWQKQVRQLKKNDIDALANKMDTWYNVAGAIDLFAALAYFFIGGNNAIINTQSKVQANNAPL